MLTVIENVLSAEEVRQFREKLAAADWQDGATTAGTRSVAVKQNLQLDRSDPLAVELGNTILRKLGHNPLFVSAALAEKIWPPVFNCYQDGGHFAAEPLQQARCLLNHQTRIGPLTQGAVEQQDARWWGQLAQAQRRTSMSI